MADDDQDDDDRDDDAQVSQQANGEKAAEAVEKPFARAVKAIQTIVVAVIPGLRPEHKFGVAIFGILGILVTVTVAGLLIFLLITTLRGVAPGEGSVLWLVLGLVGLVCAVALWVTRGAAGRDPGAVNPGATQPPQDSPTPSRVDVFQLLTLDAASRLGRLPDTVGVCAIDMTNGAPHVLHDHCRNLLLGSRLLAPWLAYHGPVLAMFSQEKPLPTVDEPRLRLAPPGSPSRILWLPISSSSGDRMFVGVFLQLNIGSVAWLLGVADELWSRWHNDVSAELDHLGAKSG